MKKRDTRKKVKLKQKLSNKKYSTVRSKKLNKRDTRKKVKLKQKLSNKKYSTVRSKKLNKRYIKKMRGGNNDNFEQIMTKYGWHGIKNIKNIKYYIQNNHELITTKHATNSVSSIFNNKILQMYTFISMKHEMRKMLLDTIFTETLKDYKIIPPISNKTFFTKISTQDIPEVNTFSFNPCTINKNDIKLAKFETAGSGLKSTSDYDFDIQLLDGAPQEDKLALVKKIQETISNYMKIYAFSFTYDTNFYFSLFHWHSMDENLTQLPYYLLAIFGKMLLRYESKEHKEQIINIKAKFIECQNILGTNILLNENDIQNIITFYEAKDGSKLQEIKTNEINMYLIYCDLFKNYLESALTQQATQLTQILCKFLLYQPESYVFPYTTASVSLDPAKCKDPTTNPCVLDLEKRQEKAKNYLQNVTHDDNKVLLDKVCALENLIDLMYNLKGKYLTRCLKNLTYTHLFQSQIQHHIGPLIFKYLDYIKLNELDKYISKDLIDYIYNIIEERQETGQITTTLQALKDVDDLKQIYEKINDCTIKCKTNEIELRKKAKELVIKLLEKIESTNTSFNQIKQKMLDYANNITLNLQK